MTEEWTGRKYRGNGSGTVYEILSEPFDWKGKKQVAYTMTGSFPSVTSASEFEVNENYTRIREAEFAVGDRVKASLNIVTIVAVASEVDRDGDFAYLYKDSDGNVDILWASYTNGKVSE